MREHKLSFLLREAKKEIEDVYQKTQKEIEEQDKIRERLANPKSLGDHIGDLENLANTLTILLDVLNKEIFKHR